MKTIRTALATLFVAFAVSIASAQTGGITVKVVDSNGEPLPAATVTISHKTGYVSTTAVLTNKSGLAEFPVLRAGAGYSININMPGFAPIQIPDLKVSIGKSQVQTVQLSEAIVEQVKVVAQQDVVDLEDTSQTTKFSDEFISDLPVPGRFYQNVLTLAPGVQDADGDGNPNVHGSRDRDFKAEVGGVSNVDPLTGQRMAEVNPNSIEEMEVITAGAGVEFSRAQGGFARIIQRQGSNEFEGIADFYYRSSLLDGTGARNNDNTFDPDFQTVMPGFQISGPILKDKLWYRLSHEWIYRDIPVATTAGVEIQTNNQEIHSDQITWQVSPRNKLAFSYQADPQYINNFGVSAIRPADAALTWDSKVDHFQVTWTAPYSPKILVETRVAWQDFSILTTPTQSGVENSCLGNASTVLKTALCNDLDTGTLSGGHNEDVDQHRQRLTVRGDTTVYAGRFAGASHQFKFGLSIENERYTRELERRPQLNLFVLRGDDEESGSGGDTGGDSGAKALVFGNFSVPVSSTDTAKGVTWGLYGEDQIKPTQNLTLTVGLRIEREEIRSDGKAPFDPEAEAAAYRARIKEIDNSCVPGQCGNAAVRAGQEKFTKYEAVTPFLNGLGRVLGVKLTTDQAPITVSTANWRTVRRTESISITNNNFSPRLSLSWDPWSNGKTKIAATAGRYYNNIPLNIPLLELEPPTATIAFDAELQPGGWAVTGLSDRINPAVNVSTVDRDLQTPHTDEWTLAIEREIAAEMSIKLSYINRRFQNQLQDVDINHAPGDFGKCRAATPIDQTVVVPITPDLGQEYDQLAAFAPGDGKLDNCQGKLETIRVPPQGEGDDPDPVLLPVPDDSLDLYVQNPSWGDILLLGNQNSIEYDGFVLELIRRQYRSWEMQASYTFSRAFGDGEDYNQFLGDDQSLIQDEQGYQAYDQRHVVKVNATTITPWGFRIGGAVSWQSGLPYSILLSNPAFDAVPNDFGTLEPGQPARVRGIYPSGQRNDQRNVSYWNVDMRLSKEFNFGRNLNMQASLEIFNLLNDGTYQVYDPFSQTGFQVNGNNNGLYRFGRQWQIGLKFAF